MKTDQSFSLQSSSAASLKSERILDNQWKTKFPISANKTEVEAFRSPDGKMPGIDPDKHRMIYKKTITLEKCRGFRMKTMDERKSFLKEHLICYKCCMSTNHKARDCKAVIHCSESNSEHV